jgi:hypothetical protein
MKFSPCHVLDQDVRTVLKREETQSSAIRHYDCPYVMDSLRGGETF